MVEHVVSVKAELRFDFFGEVEALRQRQVGEERVRAAERIASNVPDLAASGQRERSGSRASQSAGVGRRSYAGISKRSDRREPENVAVRIRVLADIERLPRKQVRTAWAGI